MENSKPSFNFHTILANKTLVVLLSAVLVLIVVSIFVGKSRRADYQVRHQEFLSSETRLADSIKSYNDSTLQYSVAYKDSIQIIKCYTSDPNSAGGVDLDLVWKNNTKKTIKYISFRVDPYNAVGDVVPCDIRGYYQSFRVTGPVQSGKVYGYGTYWDCAWYNSTIKNAKVTSVEIIFMDEKTVEFDI